MGMVGTVSLVQVKAVQPGAVGPVGTVDVQPMVSMQDGAGTTTPHGIIHALPYFRLQGGANAVIMDPVVGDIGAALIASRDISKVKATKALAAPDSFRQFSLSDGLYIGGWLNGTPTQFIEFLNPGITITTTGPYVVNASTAMFNCPITATGDVKAGSISLEAHVHGGVEPGTGDTATPVG